MSSLEGAMEALAGLDRLVQHSERGARTAVQIVLSKMQEYAKNNAPFQDRTGNLRNSIQYEMDPGKTCRGSICGHELCDLCRTP